jgi:ABC-type nitrate/sulfonate/bicarbonate transport system ATPase subunit
MTRSYLKIDHVTKYFSRNGAASEVLKKAALAIARGQFVSIIGHSIHATLKNTVIMITHDVDEAVLLSDRIVMMTNPSARIGEVLDVSLARPRQRLATGEIYIHARESVLKFPYERHRFVEAA